MDEAGEFLRIYDFSGGLNDWASSYTLRDNEAQESLNVALDEGGTLQKRKGRGSGVACTPGYACTGAARIYANPPVTTNIAGAGKCTLGKWATGATTCELRWGTTAPGTTLSLTHIPNLTSTSVDVTSRMRVVQWGNDRVYIALGTTHALRWGLASATPTWAGANVLRGIAHMGVRQIPLAGTPAEGTDQSATVATAGFYSYGISLTYGPGGAWGESVVKRTTAYEHADVEDRYKLSGWTDMYTSATDNYRTDFGVYSMKIYRTEAQTTEALASAAPLYFLYEHTSIDATSFEYEDDGSGTIVNNPSGNTTLAAGDALLDVTLPAPTAFDTGDMQHNGYNATVSMMCAHNARMYLVYESKADADDEVVDDTVYYSNINLPDEYPTQNYFKVMGRVMGIASAPYGLVVFTSRGVYVWRGWGASDFQIDEVRGAQGCVATDSIAQITMRGKQVIVYAGEDGIYGFDGHTSEYLGVTADGRGQKCGGTWKNYATSKSAAQGVAYKDYYLLAYQDTRDEGSYNNRVLAYDIRYDCWWLWDGWDVGAWCHWCGDGDSGELYYADSSTGGKFYQAFTGVDDCTWKWRSKDFPLAGPEVSMQARKCLSLIHI